KDTTPLNNYQLKPGTHSIRISMYGYLDYTSSIQISENQVTNLGVISLRLSPIQNGFLTLNSNPTGADIFIDGNLIKDTTPLNNYQLKPGTHSIRISMYGYKDSIRNIYIEANKTLSISVTLEKLEETFTMHSYGISPAKEKIVLQVGSNIITVDDKNTYHIETGPEIKDGRTFIPLIPVSEALGYNLEWFPDSKSIRLVKGDILIELQIGNEVEVIKDTDPDLGWSRKVSSGGSPFIKNNEIMVPVQFIGEVPDIAELTWDALTITIHLKG
ncbi:MAG: PEGA domain-containing protein, partial [Caldisericum sp.]